MALADPASRMVTLFLVILLPVIVIHWIVRLAVMHELKRRRQAVCELSGDP